MNKQLRDGKGYAQNGSASNADVLMCTQIFWALSLQPFTLCCASHVSYILEVRDNLVESYGIVDVLLFLIYKMAISPDST